MWFDEFKEPVFSIIKDGDPYKTSKQIQLKNWCGAFLNLLDKTRLPFFLDLLSGEICWEKTGTIQGIILNRRLAARMMFTPCSKNGIKNPLNDFELYQFACWCCLEEEIFALFSYFKQKNKIKDYDKDSSKKFVISMSRDYVDPIVEYWSHVVGGCTSELKLNGKHFYIYGLDCVLKMQITRLEAVEFFYNKIKSLPEDVLSAQQKDEVFMKTAVCAAGNGCNRYPEVFEFCFSKINSDKYHELLKRDFARNRRYGSLNILLDALRFDQFQKLLECIKLSGDLNVSLHQYIFWLESIGEKEYSGHYANAAVELFAYMWMKEKLIIDKASDLVFELVDFSSFGRILQSLVSRNNMELVWSVLNKARYFQITEFMDSKQAQYICSILSERGDQDSLKKFLSYDLKRCRMSLQ